MRWLLISGFLCALSLLAGCGTQESVAEREIERRAPEFIGPADSYDADVTGLSATRAEQVRLTGRNVRPRPDFVVETLVLTLNEVHFQRSPFKLQSVGESTFSARLTEQAVNDYLRATGRTTQNELRDIRVFFVPGEVRASATLQTALGATQLATAGTLQPAGARVDYQPQRVTVEGVNLPATVQQQLAAAVNPIIDLNGVRFTPTIQRITITQGAVLLEGTAVVTDLP